MEGQIAVSVIIPVHNGEDYILNTMQCIMEQTFNEMEIIVIDDGSTDATAEILKECIGKDKRIRYYYQGKSNAGVARNYGMHKAGGKYLLFLDSDDLFEKDMVSQLYEQIEKDKADICICNADQYDTMQDVFLSRPQYMRKKYLPEKTPFSRKEIGRAVLYITTSVPWNKMVKREFLEREGIAFQDIERANDQYFSCMALLLAKRITVVTKVLAHYRIKQKGNLTTDFSKTPLCAFEAMLAVKERLQQLKLFEEEAVRCAYDNKVLNLMLYSLNIQNTVEGYQALYNKLKQAGFKQLGLEEQDEDYYFDINEYKNYKYIIENDMQTYLLIKNREYRETIRRKNDRYNDMVKSKNKEIEELKRKEKELNYIKNTRRYRIMEWAAGIYHKIFRRRKNETK